MEKAPMLAAWDDLSPVVLALMQAERQLYQRLVCAPPRAFHCYAIFLRLADDVRQKSDKELAQRMYHENPLDLVREVFPHTGPDLLRLLGRLQPRAWQAHEYLDLEQALHNSNGRDSLLAEGLVGFVTPALVKNILQLHNLPILVATVAPKLGYDIARARDFCLMVEIMQSYGVLEPEAKAAAILRKVRPDRLSTFVQRRLARIKAPPFPVVLPSNFRLLETVSEVRAAGHRYRNCLADHYGNWRDYITGRLRILEWLGKETAILAVRHYLGELWVVDHVAGAKNERVSRETSEAMFAALRSTGLCFMDAKTATYLDWLAESPYEIPSADEDEYLFYPETAVTHA